MKKIRTPDIAKRIKNLKQEYAYMDDLTRDGWFWEMIRRSDEYEQTYKKLYTNYTLETQHEMFTLGISPCADDTCPYPSQLSEEQKEGAIIFPRPDWRYIDFVQNKQSPPACHFATPVRSMDHSMVEKMRSLLLDEGAEQATRKLFELLSPTFPEDTLYIGVALTSKMNDVLEEIHRILGPRLKKNPTKLRATDKWKYYLIIYDLMKDYDSLNYNDVAGILADIYPEEGRLFDERNVQNYRKNAVFLIEGDYKKYLYVKTPLSQ